MREAEDHVRQAAGAWISAWTAHNMEGIMTHDARENGAPSADVVTLDEYGLGTEVRTDDGERNNT